MVDLIHLGDQCAPGIIIDDIIKYNKKCLFMLGVYNFNDIIFYLKHDNLESIYDKNDLEIQPNNHIRHKKYNFIFNHDYKIEKNTIQNYDFVRSRFDIKIKNFREMISSLNMCIFITFTDNIDILNIKDMLDVLKIKKSFHLIIFTHNKYNNKYDFNNLTIIVLSQSYENWWCMNPNIKTKLYKEIYDKFIECLANNNIKHAFQKTIN